MITLRRICLPLLALTLLATAAVTGPAHAQRSGQPVRQPTFIGGVTGCVAKEVPGTRTQNFTVKGVARSYLLVVPASVTGLTPVPVIMGLHGGNGTAADANRYMGLNSTTAALYVYFQAPFWPAAGGVGWDVSPTGVDFAYFDALLADLRAKHCVNAARVFATGKSNGGFMVNALACYRPGMFNAIAPVAGGGPSTSNCPVGAPVAAMIVHGSADVPVPIKAGRWSLEYWLYRTNYVGATPAPCISYPGTTRTVLWCQHTGGHIWPTWAAAGIRGFFLRQ